MNLQSQVTSLEISKRLKDLGEKQESLFFYIPLVGGGYQIELMKTMSGRSKDISAFTASELGEMLPDLTKCWRYDYMENDTDRVWKWHCEFDHNNESADSEADARGKMLIYLLENNLITL